MTSKFNPPYFYTHTKANLYILFQDPVVDDVGQTAECSFTAEPYEEPSVLQPQTVILGCGHPCGTCLDSVSRSVLLCDHNYAKAEPRGKKDVLLGLCHRR